jgi:TonB family protein
VVQTPPAAAPAPQPPVEQPKPQKTPPRRAVDKALFGKSTEKATPKTPVAAPAPPSGASVKRDPGPAAGIVGLEGGDFPYTIYIDRMLALIGTHWLRPQTQREVLTQVYFVIERDGRVRDVKIEKESGLPSFDRAAYRAVLEASPLPPLPFGYSGTFLGVHLTFH